MTDATVAPRKHHRLKSAAELVAIVLVVLAAKTAIAEPFYVPSGSMEPTLLIGDELLATKFPYGYSAASLPAFVVLPTKERYLGALPQRGDVVVFRWPGDRSQVWVKRVIGLPGDHVSLKDGRVSINGTPVDIKPDGNGQSETEDGSQIPAARFVETLPGSNRTHPIFKLARVGALDNIPETVVPPAVCRSLKAASACCRLPIWSAASTASSAHGI
jgi:signal peptidase I